MSQNLPSAAVVIGALRVIYGKFSKILNTLLFLFSSKMLFIRVGMYKMLVRLANSEDPDENA